MTGTRDRTAVAAMIDHTLLAPEATDADVASLCREAVDLGVAAVCVSPARLPLTVPVPGVAVAAVVGFPSGAHVAEVKAEEARRAVAVGASEVDVVVDLAAAIGRRFDAVTAEVAAVRAAVGSDAVVKVIVESAVLAPHGDTLEATCRAAVAGGADMVKTSTGFHPAGGATTDAVARMRAAVGQDVGVKASGGIRDWATAIAVIDAGATRLGCSATAAILAGAPS